MASSSSSSSFASSTVQVVDASPIVKPRRASSAYEFYCKWTRETIKATFPDLTTAEIRAKLEKQWEELTEEQKKPYTDEAEADKKRFQTEKREYEEKIDAAAKTRRASSSLQERKRKNNKPVPLDQNNSRDENKDRLIKLNVGGTIFTSLESTLCGRKASTRQSSCSSSSSQDAKEDTKELDEKKETLFSRLLSNQFAEPLRDETGAYFLDRSSKAFEWILQFLRGDSGFINNLSTSSRKLLLDEALFFDIDGLVDRLNWELDPPEQKSILNLLKPKCLLWFPF